MGCGASAESHDTSRPGGPTGGPPKDGTGTPAGNALDGKEPDTPLNKSNAGQRASPESSMRTGALSLGRVSLASVPQPQLINGLPVHVYVDSTRCSVRTLISSRTKVETITRFLDASRRYRDRRGYFTNPEDPPEEGPSGDSVSQGSARYNSRCDASTSLALSSIATTHGQRDVNISIAAIGGHSMSDLSFMSPGVGPGKSSTAAVLRTGPQRSKVSGYAGAPLADPVEEAEVVYTGRLDNASPTNDGDGTTTNGGGLPGTVIDEGATAQIVAVNV